MRIVDFKKLMLRAFPGLGGWHTLRLGQVAAVYPAAGVDTEIRPLAVVDLWPLLPDLSRDPAFLVPLLKISLTTANPYQMALPEVGDVVIFAHAFWRADRAMVLGQLWRNKPVTLAPKVYRVKGPLSIELGSAEDYAVLYGQLAERLSELADLIVTASQSDSWGAPNQNLALVEQSAELIKGMVPLIKSPAIKMGTSGG